MSNALLAKIHVFDFRYVPEQTGKKWYDDCGDCMPMPNIKHPHNRTWSILMLICILCVVHSAPSTDTENKGDLLFARAHTDTRRLHAIRRLLAHHTFRPFTQFAFTSASAQGKYINIAVRNPLFSCAYGFAAGVRTSKPFERCSCIFYIWITLSCRNKKFVWEYKQLKVNTDRLYMLSWSSKWKFMFWQTINIRV